MQFQVKLEKEIEITYLDLNKQQKKVPPNVFRSFEVRKRYDSRFEGQRIAWKETVKFVVVINKEIGYAWCI